MADYYSNSYGGRKRRKKLSLDSKSLAMMLLDAFVTLAMLLLIFCTITAIICQYITPEKSGILSVIALGAPVIYLLDIVVMFYWIVRWRWYRATAMIVVVLVGFFYASRYYKLDIDRQYEVTYKERRFTKILSYNLCDGRAEGLPKYIRKHNPDILCIQEMNTVCDNWAILSEGYQNTASKLEDMGNYILTKHRIIRCGEIKGLSLRNGMWADLKIKDDTVRVVNLHLQSTSIRPEDTQFLEKHEYILDRDREVKLRSIVDRLVDNNCKRAVQAQQVADFLKLSPYTTVVCGDFNDVPLSYTYNLISHNLEDAFSRCAEGFAYTYNTRYGLLRIDNILLSPWVEIVSYEVDTEVDYSDHYPVISRVKFNQNR
jgi:endonuclease/exonuclease/phosphatase family metal-dependent hydrolase